MAKEDAATRTGSGTPPGDRSQRREFSTDVDAGGGQIAREAEKAGFREPEVTPAGELVDAGGGRIADVATEQHGVTQL